MANEEEKKPLDEYRYPDEYFSGEYKPQDETTSPLDEEEPPEYPRRGGGGRRVFMFLGLAGAILLVYAVLTFMGRPRPADTGQLVTTPPPTPVAVQTPPPAPTTAAPVPQAQPILQPEVSAATIRAQQQQIQNNQATIATLQSQIQQMQSQMLQMGQSISTLTSQIQVMADEVKAVVMGREIQQSKALLPPRKAGVVYQLKALVPGRAWLQSAQGKVITVTTGDRLPGYGIIQMIDTTQGLVTTSSGRLIQYGPRDS